MTSEDQELDSYLESSDTSMRASLNEICELNCVEYNFMFLEAPVRDHAFSQLIWLIDDLIWFLIFDLAKSSPVQ